MRTSIDSPAYSATVFPEIRYLLATVIDNPGDGTTTILALNRHLTEPPDFSAE